MAKGAGKRLTKKGTATAGQVSKRVIVASDRPSKSSAKAQKGYSSTSIGRKGK